MITRREILDSIKNNVDIYYDEKTDLIHYPGGTVKFEDLYQRFIKENGMSFRCICDVHWECMSVIECTECGTVVKEYYDEYYEPNFRCPTCTDYKTGYEYYTKSEIDSSEELQEIINMYKGLNSRLKEQYDRIEKRNGLEDYQLFKPRQIRIGNNVYKFNLLIDSITNKNKLQGLRLEITKLEKKEFNMERKWNKIFPLSKKAYHFYKHVLPEIENNPNLDFLNQFKGKTITQTMEEAIVERVMKPQNDLKK